MNIAPTDQAAVWQTLRRFGLRPNKKLGQNFLAAPEVFRQIVAAAAIGPEDQVLEIGPGLGALTEQLAQSGCQRVVALEVDRRFAPLLKELERKYANLEIVYQDALKADIKALMGGRPFKAVANLPYYITTPIIMRFLEEDLPYERLILMVQNEVAVRMASPPGSRDYGALSVAVQYHTQASLLFTVPPEAFVPSPEVTSAVVSCQRRAAAVAAQDKGLFFQIVRAAFAQRRKMLANSLKNMGLTAEQTSAWLQMAGIDGQRRAETLSLAEFARLESTFSQWR